MNKNAQNAPDAKDANANAEINPEEIIEKELSDSLENDVPGELIYSTPQEMLEEANRRKVNLVRIVTNADGRKLSAIHHIPFATSVQGLVKLWGEEAVFELLKTQFKIDVQRFVRYCLAKKDIDSLQWVDGPDGAYRPFVKVSDRTAKVTQADIMSAIDEAATTEELHALQEKLKLKLASMKK